MKRIRTLFLILALALCVLTACNDTAPDGGSTDSGSTDNGSTDNGNTDSGSTDNGNTDNDNADNGGTAGNEGYPTLAEVEMAVGVTFTYGAYEQDNHTENGKEPIVWQVLAVDGERALVISKYALDAQAYHADGSNTSWEESDIRAWLNGDFAQAAFTADEKDILFEAVLTNPGNSLWGSEGGNDTRDKLFFLSEEEASTYFASRDARVCEPTAYAVAQGAEKGSVSCYWWLRTPGINTGYALHVEMAGDISDAGSRVALTNLGVRPAAWLSIH